MDRNLSRYWQHNLPDGRIQCDLCPRACHLYDGQRGACFVRQRQGQEIALTAYGLSSGFCIDPIEKKPLNHFYPGSSVLSFGTAGCNLACKFCQNWDISKSREVASLSTAASPSEIADACMVYGVRSVAFTYNDPVIFAEYAMDTAEACHAIGIKTVAVTAGYITELARSAFFSHMDAVNVDLKAFSDDFYIRHCGGHLKPVLDTLVYLKHSTHVWLEITTLLIPGLNDHPDEIAAMCAWIYKELGSDVPLHFTAYHPAWKMLEPPPTPARTLIAARQIALLAGLKYVYLGNIHSHEGATTHCPICDAELIVRDAYNILKYQLSDAGSCLQCGHILDGCFGEYQGSFGTQRIPIQINPAQI